MKKAILFALGCSSIGYSAVAQTAPSSVKALTKDGDLIDLIKIQEYKLPWLKMGTANGALKTDADIYKSGKVAISTDALKSAFNTGTDFTKNATLNVMGSYAGLYAGKTANYTLADEQFIAWDGTTSGDFTLPTGTASEIGRLYTVINRSTNTAVVLKLKAATGENIKGETELSISDGDIVTVVRSAGNAWEIVNWNSGTSPEGTYVTLATEQNNITGKKTFSADNFFTGNNTIGGTDKTTTITGAALNITGETGITGNTSVTGTLNATEATTLGSTLTVTGASTLNDKLTVTANGAEITGATTITGETGISGNTSVTGTLNATEATTLGSTLTVTGTSTLNDKLTVTANGAEITGETTITGNTSVTGATTLTGPTTITGATSVTGATTLTGTANITGDMTLGSSGTKAKLLPNGTTGTAGQILVSNDDSQPEWKNATDGFGKTLTVGDLLHINTAGTKTLDKSVLKELNINISPNTGDNTRADQVMTTNATGEVVWAKNIQEGKVSFTTTTVNTGATQTVPVAGMPANPSLLMVYRNGVQLKTDIVTASTAGTISINTAGFMNDDGNITNSVAVNDLFEIKWIK